ncbi:MAG: hypothetical protein ACK5PQ_05080 [Alphaproteobacteria bacterium]
MNIYTKRRKYNNGFSSAVGLDDGRGRRNESLFRRQNIQISSGRSSVFSRQLSRLEIVNSYPGLCLQELKQRQKSFHEQFQQAMRGDETLATEWNALQHLRKALIKIRKEKYTLEFYQNRNTAPAIQQKLIEINVFFFIILILT